MVRAFPSRNHGTPRACEPARTARVGGPSRWLAFFVVALVAALVALTGLSASARAEDKMDTTLARARMRVTQAQEVCSGVIGMFCENRTIEHLREQVADLEKAVKEYRDFRATCKYSDEETKKLNDLYDRVGREYETVESAFDLVYVDRDAGLQWFGIIAGIVVVLLVVVLFVVLKTRKKKAPVQAYPPGYGPPQGQWPQGPQQGQRPQQGQWPPQGPQ